MIWFSAATTSVVDTGVDFLLDTTILRVYPEIVTTVAGGTLDVGIDTAEAYGDIDALIDGASTATAGYPLPTLTTSGASMDDTTNFDPNGHQIESASGKSLAYTTNCTGGTAAGYIYYDFLRNR
jgi:hypothetical protein